MQYLDFHILGSTFDPLDLLMYFMGISIALILDFLLFSNRGLQ